MGGRKLSDIAAALSSAVSGDGNLVVTRLVHPADSEGSGDLAIALTDEALGHLATTRAGAVVIPPGKEAPAGSSAIPYRGNERIALAILSALFDPGPAHEAGVHASAVVAPDARLAAGVSVGPNSTIGAGTSVGPGSVILANVTIGAGVSLGRDCIIYPGVRIGDRVEIGDRVRIQFNAAIGADGFSFIPVSNPDGSSNGIERPMRTHSLGTVVIGDDVEIGASTAIDRATLRETRIGRGPKIDNQVQIAHNVVIGENCLICGLAGIAGSAVIGDRVVIASEAGVADHVIIGDGATIAATSGVATNVPAGAVYSGTPAIPHVQSLERYANTARLKSFYPRVEDLKKRVEALEKASEGR
jgi:UDP-3-O-[3-hydroxymyristoyl] glucosamine N-acyltransferase